MNTEKSMGNIDFDQVKEKMEDMNELLFNIELMSENTEELHINEEIEVVYVVSGNCLVNCQSQKYKLNKEDVMLINSGKEHNICVVGEKNLICRIKYSYYAIVKEIEEKFIRFKCNSTLENDARYMELKKMIKTLLSMYDALEKQEYNIIGQYYLILGYLLDHFKVSGISMESSNEKNFTERMSFIRIYIQDHFQESALLTKLSNELYMSPSALSRYFKKMTGESISQYILKMKMKKVEELLLFGNISMTDIAMESGFSSASSMNKNFRKYYGVTPGQYRRENKESEQEKKKAYVPVQKKQLETVLIKQEDRQQDRELSVRVDVQNTRETAENSVNIINIGAVSDLKNARVQKQLCQMLQKTGMEYVRMDYILSGKCFNESRRHQWGDTDVVFDFCMENNIKPFIHLKQNIRLNDVGSDENILTSEREWLGGVEFFIRHICDRYGLDIIRHWVIEFSPFSFENACKEASKDRAANLWKKEYGLIRKYIPTGKIAAPGISLKIKKEDLEDMMSSIWSTGCIPDIFTSCAKNDEKEMSDFIERETDFSDRINRIKEELGKRRFAGKYCITSWEDISGENGYIMDSCSRGCFLLDSVLENYGKADIIGIRNLSDLSDSTKDTNELLQNKCGLISRDDIFKPAWYAIYFAKKAGRNVIGKGEHYYISGNRDGSFCIVCTNREESELHIGITLENIQEPGEYVVSEEFVNEQNGSILNEWEKMEYDKNLSYEEIAYLKRISVPARKKYYVKMEEGKLKQDIILQANEMRLVVIRKIEEDK